MTVARLHQQLTVSVLLIVAIVIVRPPSAVAACRGCVELGELTFDRMLKHFPHGALVKFDVSYPYGAKEEAYDGFALEAAEQAKRSPVAKDLLVVEVGIKSYGEMDNALLAKRFDIPDKYPVVVLFVGGANGTRIRFDEADGFTVDALKQFVRRYTGIGIGMHGVVAELDQLAAKLSADLTLNDLRSAEVTVEAARRWLADALEKHSNDRDRFEQDGDVYLRLMDQTLKQGVQYVPQEIRRVRRLLAGKVSESKRSELQQRLNVLNGFDIFDDASNSVRDDGDL